MHVGKGILNGDYKLQHEASPVCPSVRQVKTRRHFRIKFVNNKEFLCITHTVEHNYTSHSSTVGIQLHVSAHKHILV